MKTLLIISVSIIFFLIIAFVIYVRLTLPSIWSLKSGSVTISKININGDSYLKIDGEPINYIGQFQVIDVQANCILKKIIIKRFVIRFNPFSSITCNNQWPLLFPIYDLEKGDYKVVYVSNKNVEEIAGIITVEEHQFKVGSRRK